LSPHAFSNERKHLSVRTLDGIPSRCVTFNILILLGLRATTTTTNYIDDNNDYINNNNNNDRWVALGLTCLSWLCVVFSTATCSFVVDHRPSDFFHDSVSYGLFCFQGHGGKAVRVVLFSFLCTHHIPPTHKRWILSFATTCCRYVCVCVRAGRWLKHDNFSWSMRM
jgi:hypothetical protein